MDLNTFLDHFDTIAEAPSGITQLKALILDLAVRGKLVPQDPEEEPASVLLDKSKFEKEQWLKSGKIRKSKLLPPIDKEELPYQSPQGWQWCRFSNVVFFQEGPGIRNWQFRANGIKLLNVKNIVQGELVLENSDKYISEEEFNQKYNHFLIEDGDLLFASSGNSWGKTAFFKNLGYRVIVNTSTIRMRFFVAQCSNQYLRYFLDSDLFKRQMQIQLQGIQPNFGALHLTKVLIPLPPLAEQKRIVEKVDELMALCDRFAAAKQTRDDLRQKLRGSAISALMNAETDEAVEKSCAIVRDNWQTISQDPKDVDDLRKIILRLAIRGKLTQQEVSDEPAEKLLQVVADKHAAHPKKFRKPKDLSSIEDVEKPFELSFGWCWCRFTEIGQLERGKSKHRPRNDPALYEGGSIPLVQTGDVARAKGVVTTYTALYNEQGLAQSRLWPKGTLCITIAANIADSAMLGFDACFPDSVVGFVPTEPISDSRYFEFFIRTMKSTLEAFAPSTAQKNINLSILDEVLIPLPPLVEQKRIVAKIDELMQMCDQLEASLRQTQQQASALAASAISHLTI